MSFELSLFPVIRATPTVSADADAVPTSGTPKGKALRAGQLGRRAALIAACALGLAGCVSADEQRRIDLGQCSGYGFEPDSDGFANCMMNIDQNRERIRADRSLQAQADLAAQNREREARSDLYKALSQQRVGDKSLPVCGAASGGGFDGRTGYWYGKDCRSR